jgi:hypothetical protein
MPLTRFRVAAIYPALISDQFSKPSTTRFGGGSGHMDVDRPPRQRNQHRGIVAVRRLATA